MGECHQGWFGVLLGGLFACSSTAGASAESEQRRAYTGTFGWFSEQPDGGETCAFRQPDWETKGYLRLRSQGDAELEIYEEGVGCRLIARSEDGQVYTASAAACEWNAAVSLRELGFIERTFDHWQYDSESGDIEATGKTVRKTAGGQRMVSCFELNLKVERN